MVAPFLNIVTLCPQTYYDIVQGDLVIIGRKAQVVKEAATKPIIVIQFIIPMAVYHSV